MSDLLTLVPPWVAFLLATVVVVLAPRRLGAAVAVALTALTVPWVLLAPAGTSLAVAPFGFEQVLFRVDSFTRPVAALFGFVAALNVLYGYATGADPRQTAYSLCYMGAGVAAVLAGDWLTLLVAWELLAVTATVLVWHHGGDAVRPAFRYAVYHLLGGTLLVAAVALHYLDAGTFLYADGIGGGLAAGLPTTLAIVGVGVNLGFIGLHAWLPDTYPRPHVAASVVLAGFTTKVAVYVLARVAPDGDAIVVWLGALMVLYGVTQAILQTDMRRLLSYHIISQVGYMVVAVGIGTAAGLTGAFAHLTAHVLYKGLLFMVAGVIIVRTGRASLKHLGGLGRRMPVTFVTFLVAALAITGVPGFSGFVSKGLVTKAAQSAGGELLWWVLVLGSVGTALSFAKFGYYAFVRQSPEPIAVSRAPLALSVALVIAAIPSVVFGVVPEAFLAAHPGDPGKFAPYATTELTKALAATAVGILAFAVLKRPLGRIHPVDVDQVLHPFAAGLANATAAAAIGIGGAASRGRAALGRSLAAHIGRDPAAADSSIHAALTALALTTALALLVAIVA
ncbi:proton-conducting transporter membrane subunit [Haloarchaeobius sp. HME9146]|uniref:proton-conducting transporter transmembrane domain-containing protein n=1 Tax=Haloarchaeobius sp. HME9146 TaxID=2978732 RepID=UPI0021C07CC8|nr:proton-conducting transporter membrane subunit [Haloarchaeobius sp. HME9146]MCT9097940.1 proton-conducting transporter membrane subunit [Haloarchaeobius sp. HME9146]